MVERYAIFLNGEQISPSFKTGDEASRWGAERYDVADDRVSIGVVYEDEVEHIINHTVVAKQMILNDLDFLKEAESYLQDENLTKDQIAEIARSAFDEFNWDMLKDVYFDCMDKLIQQEYEQFKISKLGEKLNKGE